MKNLIQSVLILISVLIAAKGAEEVIYAQVGERVILKPPAVDKYKYMYWRFGSPQGIQLAWRNYLSGNGIDKEENKFAWSGSSLVISNIEQNNFGTYYCVTSDPPSDNLAAKQVKLVKLNVTNPSSPLLPGESLSLACSVEDSQGDQKPNIYWQTPNGQKIKNILVKHVTSQHNGKWTCVVKNGENEKHTQISVKVLDLSPAFSSTQYTSNSSRITIPCSFAPDITWEHFKAKDIQEVYWQFSPKIPSGVISGGPQRLFTLSLQDSMKWNVNQHTDLKTQDPKKGDLSLTRKLGKEEDRGDYECIMKFKGGKILNRTVRVEVLQIISSPRPELISGQPLNLTCSTGNQLPSDVQLKWSPPKQSSLSPPIPDPHPAKLTIPQVHTGDEGEWECTLWQGSKQLTSAVITLKIEPKLSVWMLVIICSAAVVVILILILIFIFYRRRQRKMRHLRHRLCQCKNPKPKGFYRT
ncbi:CD4-1 molecule [Lates calcarifer]|uniref:CD4-1 molecule n=1 Tax=Lates calcarifer TaxID=8187 RepID=A0AAJ7PJG0_LATCA|nr:CD4-1 molecule [Lates calcarifer]